MTLKDEIKDYYQCEAGWDKLAFYWSKLKLAKQVGILSLHSHNLSEVPHDSSKHIYVWGNILFPLFSSLFIEFTTAMKVYEPIPEAMLVQTLQRKIAKERAPSEVTYSQNFWRNKQSQVDIKRRCSCITIARLWRDFSYSYFCKSLSIANSGHQSIEYFPTVFAQSDITREKRCAKILAVNIFKSRENRAVRFHREKRKGGNIIFSNRREDLINQRNKWLCLKGWCRQRWR